jgi:hypothetical protein
MAVKSMDSDAIPHDMDWEGNNAAFTCPVCSKVFIVSGHLHSGSRECPICGKATGNVTGGKKSGGSAYIRYEDSN